MMNTFIIKGDIVEIDILDKDGKVGMVAVVDLHDFDKVKNIKWSNNGNGYIRNSRKNIYIHQAIMGTEDGLEIDHKDRNPLNNRRNNLRQVTHRSNIYNNPKQTNNTSGIVGVSWRKDRNRWRAHIKVNQKYKNLGHFINFDDAVEARRKAEEEHSDISISPR